AREMSARMNAADAAAAGSKHGQQLYKRVIRSTLNDAAVMGAASDRVRGRILEIALTDVVRQQLYLLDLGVPYVISVAFLQAAVDRLVRESAADVALFTIAAGMPAGAA